MKSNSIMAMALYRPHPGKEKELLEILKNQVPTLRKEGLVTDRQEMLLQAQDGTYIEIFEWVSEEAKNKAHELPAVMKDIWEKMMEIAEFPSLSELKESDTPFPGFKVV
jgi:quinol monooxygenase YgiN